MDVHKNARTTPHSRETIVGRVLAGESARAVGDDVGVCESTVRKWVRRYQAEGRGASATAPVDRVTVRTLRPPRWFSGWSAYAGNAGRARRSPHGCR